MIRPSPELIAVVRRWNAAVRNKDGEALFNMLSPSEHLRYQGTADDESWAGQLFRKGFPDHVAEIPEFEWQELSLEAFENGTTGWAHCHAMLTFASNGISALHRFTFVLSLEDGLWRMVQIHVSNSIPNIDKIGVEHHALNDLVASARQGFRLDQREGLATIMFTDIVNSASIAEHLGDRVWAQAVAAHLDMVSELIAANDGQLVKSLGDGTMSSFTSARAALVTASAIQRGNLHQGSEPPLQLRIGIHTGDVIQTSDDFFGSVVNKAARVAGLTGPGEIRVTEATRMMTEGFDDFAFSGALSVTLKGLSGDHLTHRLDWREQPDT